MSVLILVLGILVVLLVILWASCKVSGRMDDWCRDDYFDWKNRKERGEQNYDVSDP